MTETMRTAIRALFSRRRKVLRNLLKTAPTSKDYYRNSRIRQTCKLIPYWATWRDLNEANYWENKYYNVHDADQVYEGTFCSPALAGDKTAYALFTGCGGVMVFRVGCDKTMDDPNSVACGIENTLHRYFNAW